MTSVTLPDEKIQKNLPWIAALAMFMQSLDATILNTALPSIARDLNRSALSMQSVIVCYTLTLALLIPLSGWLADRFGSQKVFILAMSLFTLGSFACAVSQTLPELVASRILQAVGGSMMVPVSRLAILYTYSKDKLLTVINFITIPGLVGPIVGPTLGGWLVDIASWHWIFLINIPIGVIGVLWARKVMPDYKQAKKKFDFSGMLLFGGSLVLLTVGIELGSEKVIAKWWLLAIIGLGFLLMNLYYWHYKRTESPIINLHLIRIRTLRIGIFGNLLTRLGIGGMPLMLPLLFQVGLQHSAMVSGMMMIPVALSAVLIKQWVVPIVRFLGYKKTLLINTIIIAVVISLFSFTDTSTPLPNLIPLLVIFGAVNSIQLTAMNTLSLSDLDQQTASGGNSILMVMQQLSMSLGISVGAFLISTFREIRGVESYTNLQPFHDTFLTMGIITALSSLLFLRLKKTDGAELAGNITESPKS
ncbi:DHA2 family efflux MFS transporter permease subunit [Gynurincola endophyticus]|uniref:DHA2 family efflux MFS transporter permease subunit n=1 Tax=Gynurincola endophyticus TaxID=2479004 RepID=UPI0018F6690A|nr:DHA2 family efflux MFS transporter permease subunit [Gynurincola endophyticus]